LVFGQIDLVLQAKHDSVYFIVDEFVSKYNRDLHLHVLHQTGVTKCVAAVDLLDYYPLYWYDLKGAMHVPLQCIMPSVLHGSTIDNYGEAKLVA
jgi:hypothetical protein